MPSPLDHAAALTRSLRVDVAVQPGNRTLNLRSRSPVTSRPLCTVYRLMCRFQWQHCGSLCHSSHDLETQPTLEADELSLAGPTTSIIFVATNIILSRLNKTHILSRQKYACRDKSFVFVATNICSDKRFVATKIFCRNKSFVAASIILSRQKTFF